MSNEKEKAGFRFVAAALPKFVARSEQLSMIAFLKN